MIRVVFTTFANEADAAKVIRSLVEEKLAACGTILPGARSIYSWNGEIEDMTEVVVLLKTATATLPKLEQRLLALHPYETPEIIAMAPESVSSGYAAWVLGNSSK
jgi:periplasmic divalent cation tolerance protein